MAIRFYDEALVDKISSWILDQNMTILKPDEVNRLFQITTDKQNDRPLQLPLIAISRDRDFRILNPNKTQLSTNGARLDIINDKGTQLNAIPIELGYQLDIYTRHYVEGDEYLRNFIFNLINYPSLMVKIPYNGEERLHRATINISDIISDNSDIPQRLFPGQFTRWTISLNIEDAYLFSIPTKDVVKIVDSDENNATDGSSCCCCESEVVDKEMKVI